VHRQALVYELGMSSFFWRCGFIWEYYIRIPYLTFPMSHSYSSSDVKIRMHISLFRNTTTTHELNQCIISHYKSTKITKKNNMHKATRVKSEKLKPPVMLSQMSGHIHHLYTNCHTKNNPYLGVSRNVISTVDWVSDERNGGRLSPCE
jgi:hypothetical protein